MDTATYIMIRSIPTIIVGIGFIGLTFAMYRSRSHQTEESRAYHAYMDRALRCQEEDAERTDKLIAMQEESIDLLREIIQTVRDRPSAPSN